MQRCFIKLVNQMESSRHDLSDNNESLTEISQQLLDGLPRNVVQMFMSPSGQVVPGEHLPLRAMSAEDESPRRGPRPGLLPSLTSADIRPLMTNGCSSPNAASINIRCPPRQDALDELQARWYILPPTAGPQRKEVPASNHLLGDAVMMNWTDGRTAELKNSTLMKSQIEVPGVSGLQWEVGAPHGAEGPHGAWEEGPNNGGRRSDRRGVVVDRVGGFCGHLRGEAVGRSGGMGAAHYKRSNTRIGPSV
ncbi:hypothetical protein EYF80_018306 [Liparis tanakae]|uniref:Uncharacterized protein n=1 Tax=Liparis tanakae TaxID=230148 RepID=A0A4Z2I2K5_9TELE|nr:hypothetical protein EYF80_018306 [Liparis tanakae]